MTVQYPSQHVLQQKKKLWADEENDKELAHSEASEFVSGYFKNLQRNTPVFGPESESHHQSTPTKDKVM